MNRSGANFNRSRHLILPRGNLIQDGTELAKAESNPHLSGIWQDAAGWRFEARQLAWFGSVAAAGDAMACRGNAGWRRRGDWRNSCFTVY